MDYSIKYVRLTSLGKTSDHYLSAQIKTSTEEQTKGRLFSLVEINNKWFPSAQIGQLIVNSLARSYFGSDSTSDLENFENAIRNTNETLTNIAHEGETNWVGNLNSALALSVDNKFHLSTTGQVNAFLFRKNKTILLNETTDGERPHPLKTFGELTSGSLAAGDKILITTPSIFDYFTKNDVAATIHNNSPYQTALIISKSLKKKTARPLNLIILEVLRLEDLENQPAEPEVLYLDQQSMEKLATGTRKIKEALARLLGLSARSIKKVSKYSYDFSVKIIAPLVLRMAKKAQGDLGVLLKVIKTKAAPLIKKLAPKKIVERETSRPETSPELRNNLIGKSLYTIHHYSQIKNSQLPAHLSRFFIGYFQKFIQKIKLLLNWLLAKKNRIWLYILIISLLFIILVANVGILREKQKKAQQQLSSQELTQDMKNKKDEGRLALLYNDKEKAKKIFNEVVTNLQNKKPVPRSELYDIFAYALGELDKLTSTTRYESYQKISDFPNAEEIFVTDDYIISASPKDNKIYYFDQAAKQLNQHSSIPPSKGDYSAGVLLEKSLAPVFLTTNRALFWLKNPALAPDELRPKSGEWPSAVKIASFSDNLYFMDPIQGQIYKYLKSNDGYEQGETYLDTQQVDIKKSLSLAIDGAIYVLKEDGSVIKLIKGNPQNFSVSGIPTPNDRIAQPKKIWTSDGVNHLFILENNRILKLDKSGRFIAQLAFSTSLNNIKDFWLDYKTNKLYLLNANEVYLIEI